MDKASFTKKFGVLLRQHREKVSINQSELARLCFKDRQYIHRIEKGEITPTIFTVYLICTELNIDINSLIPND
jgi:transcriptional regulator with XRE-family HTH domain